MFDFSPLEQLTMFNFDDMRALNDKRALDEALIRFHELIHGFFDQFSKLGRPSPEIMAIYLQHMLTITQHINASEYKFHLNKYLGEGLNLEMSKQLASLSELSSYKGIPKRMQYWAAVENFGDTLRFPQEHRRSVKYLQAWEMFNETQDEENTPALNI